MIPGVHNLNEMDEPNICALLYGAPGSGKTTAIGEQPGRTLIIDIDHSSDVLRGNANSADIDIVRIPPDLSGLQNVIAALEQENGAGYQNIVIDNLSELERNMLTVLAKDGKNGGAPAQKDYLIVQYKLADYVKRFRALPGRTIFTAWEDLQEIVSPTGEKYTQFIPLLGKKSAKEICGLCNIVGHLEVNPKDDQKRFVRLSGSQKVYAKDQLGKRNYCETGDFLNAV